MSLTDNVTPAAKGEARSNKMSAPLPIEIPNGRVHVYFVRPSVMTNDGKVERSVIYYTDREGRKLKYMAKLPAVREDLIALGKREDLATIDEVFEWFKGGCNITLVPHA